MWVEYEPEDLIEDPGLLRLKGEAAYLFVLLANRALRHGRLPDDREVYRALWRGRFTHFDAAWDAVRRVIDVEEGWIVFDWAVEARDSATVRLKSQRERQQKSRRDKRENRVLGTSNGTCHGDVTVTSLAGHCDVTASRARGPTDRYNRPTDKIAAASAPAKPAPAAKPKSPPSGEHAEFITWWCEAFLAACGSAYDFQGGKDGKHVQRILGRAGGALEARRRAAILLASAPSWMARGGVDLGTLDTQWNKLVSAGVVGEATGARQLAIQDALHTNGHHLPREELTGAQKLMLEEKRRG